MTLSRAWWFTAVIASLVVVPTVYYSQDKFEAGIIVFAWLWGLICIGLYDWKVRH